MKVLIYGYGRMGRTFHNILGSSGNYVKIYSLDEHCEVSEIDFGRFDAAVLCVPESAYPEVLEKLPKGILVVDISSTKEKTLPLLRDSGHEYLSIHPLFGENIYPYFSEVMLVESNSDRAKEFLKMLESTGMRVIDGREHDKEMAKVQGVTHFTLLALYEYLKDTHSRTALLNALLPLCLRLKTQNPEVIKRIQEVAKDEREGFLNFLKEFNEKFMENFESYFGLEGDYSFLLNAAKIYEKPKSLVEYRNYLEVIDSLIMDLLNLREQAAREIALIKKEKSIPIEVKEVEERKLNRLLKKPRNPIITGEIFSRIFQLSKEVQYEILGISGLVGVLGPEGSYSEEAALNLIGNRIFLRHYGTIEDVFRGVEKGEVAYGVVPIENSLTGSVAESLESLLSHDVFAIGEVDLRISHCLVARSHVDLKKVRYVYSHPQAVMQCMNFLRRNLSNAEIIYASSTSQALKMLDDDSVAIASENAARLSGCVVLKRDIQDNKENRTRFYIITRDGKVDKPEVTALFFSVEDRPGSLKEILDVFYEKRINLRKLESRPDRRNPGKYIFFTEAEANLDDEIVRKLKEKTEFVKIVGKLKRMDFLEV